MLYVIATPIGNLGDITYRAISVLRDSDYILCEDTRHSQALLKHYAIQKPLKSYHKFNLASQEDKIIEDLKQGKKLALISDAGTPGISDPGTLLIQRCKKENLPVTALPGPCAAICALTFSGLPTERFQFVGFLPKKKKELQLLLQEFLSYPGVSICYESPHRLVKTLQEIKSLQEGAFVCVARELTKVFEESLYAKVEELLEHFQKKPPKGEIVLLIQGQPSSLTSPEVSPLEQIKKLQEEGYSLRQAIKLAATLSDISKRELYKAFHEEG